ncbi:hypothetical protein AB1N83_012621 [Pleurotus pulmonarius]
MHSSRVLAVVIAAAAASRIPISTDAESDSTLSYSALADRQDDPEPTCTPQGLPCADRKCCEGFTCMWFHAYPHGTCIPCPPEWTGC